MDLMIFFMRAVSWSLVLVLLAPQLAVSSSQKDASKSAGPTAGNPLPAEEWAARMPAQLVSACSKEPNREDTDTWLAFFMKPKWNTAALLNGTTTTKSTDRLQIPAEYVVWLDEYLQYENIRPAPGKIKQSQNLCNGRHAEAFPQMMRAARRGDPLMLPVGKVLAEEDATLLLAQYADCMQPARIVLLVDQVLHHNAHQPSGTVVWIMSMGDLETMLLYSEVIVRKSARWRVPLSALALKVMRNEVVVPVLSVPVSLPTRVSTCPAWRSYLNAVTVLTYWHGYDVMVGFNGVLAEVTAGEVLGLTAEESKTTPLARVSHVVGDVLEWWRQPAARHVLSTVPEADLWSAFVQRSQGDSSWEARSPPVLVQLMSGELPELRRPTTVELRLGDISAFVHSLKLTLTRYGCLYTPDSVPDHFMTRAFTVSPGCQMLREYMQSAEGSAAYVRLHAADPGITGFFVRLFARISLNLYLLRDALLLSLEPMFSGYGEGFFALWGASRPVKHALKKSAPTVFEWMAQTDPWTVFGTSIAALLAVLRVAVRLSSAFSTAASISTVPLAQDNLTITGPSATPDASATGAAPAPGANRKGKKSTKGRNKAPKSKTPRSTTSIPPAADFQPPIAEAPPRVAAAQPPAQPARPTLPQDTAGASASSQSQAEQPVVYDPVAQRLVSSWPQGPVSSSIRATSCKLPQVRPPASPRTVELLRTAMLPAPAGDLSPSLARALVAGLPRMLFMPSSALLRHTATIEAGAAAAAAVKLPTVEVEIKDHASKGKADSVHMASSPRQSSGEVAGEFIRTSAALSAGGHDTQGAHVTEPSHSPSHSTRNDSGSGLMHHHAHSSAELIPQVGAVSVGSTACTAGAAVRAHAAAEASAVASVISSLSSGSSAAVSSAGGTDKCSTGGKGEGSDRLQVLRKEECGQVPELFLCPISREVMENPVLASDGHVYERSQIESWLQEHDTSPMTNIAMRPEVAPVLSLRSEIQDFKQRYPHLL